MCQGATDYEQVATTTLKDQGRVRTRRDQAEQLLARAAYLPDGDRLLLRQVFELGLRPADIAKAARCKRHIIYRRVHSLLRRLREPLFVFVAGHLETLDHSLQSVARAIVLHGMTQQLAARSTGMTIHLVRQHLLALRTLARRQAHIGFGSH